MSELFEVHLKSLNPDHGPSRPEYDAYSSLVREHRDAAERLRRISVEMAGYRDLPMADHDMTVLMSPLASAAFGRAIEAEEGLLDNLRRIVQEHRAMYVSSGAGERTV
jgi:hypothetical protein